MQELVSVSLFMLRGFSRVVFRANVIRQWPILDPCAGSPGRGMCSCWYSGTRRSVFNCAYWRVELKSFISVLSTLESRRLLMNFVVASPAQNFDAAFATSFLPPNLR